MRLLRTAQDTTGTVRRCSRSLLLACHSCSRPPASALPIPRAVRLCHSRGPCFPPRPSVARYRATVPAEFLDRNQPSMFITLYFIVTRLPESLHFVRDQFLSLDPTSLTVDLLEQHLLEAETSAVAVDVPSAEDIGAASASATRRSGKGKGGRSGGSGSRGSGGGSSGGGGGSGGGGNGGSGGGSGGVGAGGGGSSGSGGSGSGGSGGGRTGVQSGGQTCGKAHTQHCCFSYLDDEFGDDVELLRSGVAIFDLDYDAILSAMYALSASAEGDCYRCVPPNPGIDAAALCASESVLPGTAPAEALHTFTLDTGASRCFFRDSTTLTPLPAHVPFRLADPSGGPVDAHSSTIFLCPAVPSSSLSGLHLPSFSTNLVSTAALQDAMVTTTTPGGQRVSICTCTRTGRHLATFTRRPGSSLYTLATEPPQVAASAQVSASGQVAPPRCHGVRLYLHDPCGCSPFSVVVCGPYAAHQLNLWPRVSFPETSPTMRWTGKVGDATRNGQGDGARNGHGYGIRLGTGKGMGLGMGTGMGFD
ncbi:unnamed protein product [Closterium sp. NIES-54]